MASQVEPSTEAARDAKHGTDQASEQGAQERFLPGELRGTLVEAEHLLRYHFATQFAEGRHTLDAACGQGFGTLLLARTGAQTVTGVDIDPAAYAQSDSERPENVRFQEGDVTALSYPDDSFGLVVSFETIEHVPDPFMALDQLARVTDQEKGILLVSSPNKGIYPEGNEFHERELEAEELLSHLRERFTYVTPLRQHNWVSAAILDDESFELDDPALTVGARVRKAAGAEPGKELYTLAICSNAPLPPVQNGLLITQGLEVKDWIGQIQETVKLADENRELALEAGDRAAEATRRLAEVEGEFFQARAKWEASMATLQDRIAWIEAHELDLRPRIEKRPWVGKLLGAWVFFIRTSRRGRRFLARTR